MRQPPAFISWLLKKVLRPHLFDGIYGDLLQAYRQDLAKKSARKAQWNFLVNGLGFIRFPSLMNLKKNEYTAMSMWKNYLKISLRNLSRDKVYTGLSLVGLVVSFIACMAIFQYVQFERSYDGFHNQTNRFYRLTHKMSTSSTTSFSARTFFGAKEDLTNEIPEIVQSTQIFSANSAVLNKGDHQILEEDVIFISSEFFELFNFQLLEGRIGEALYINSIFLSKTTAEKLFPNQNALNQTLEVSGLLGQTWTATISGIYEDLPTNTHLTAQIMVPIQKLLNVAEEAQFFGPNLSIEQVRWRWLSFHTYVILDEQADQELVETKINAIVDGYREEIDARLNQNHDIVLQPVQSIHTTSGVESELSPVNDLKILNLFAIVAICIVVIGWINYVNMSTARSVSRGKEVGIRKVLGSGKAQLKAQFQTEALVLNVVSFLLSFVAVLLLAPYLEALAGIPFFDSFWQNSWLIAGMLVLVLLGSFLSSLYPSHILSNYKSIDVLKGKLKNSSKGVLLRRVLVGVQFVFTLFLMSGLLVVHHQMNFMVGHDLGINIDKTILVEIPVATADNEDRVGKMRSFKNELEKLSGVSGVAVGSMAPGIENNWRNSTENTESEKAGIYIHRSIIDHDYFELYDVELLAGRMFDRSFNEAENILINLNSAEKLGYLTPEDAVGDEITFAGQTFNVIGVVDDFYQRGVQFEIEPFSFNLDTALNGGYISLRTGSQDISSTLASVEDLFKQIFPEAPFQSHLIKDVFLAQYENEQRFRVLFSIFTSIATVIAILGFVGLASFMMSQRIKEICVRKVLGARSHVLFLILNKEYFFISTLAFIVTVPMAFLFTKNWLEGFENRIELGLIYFLIPFVITLVIVLLATVGYTLRVINANPSIILKEED